MEDVQRHESDKGRIDLSNFVSGPKFATGAAIGAGLFMFGGNVDAHDRTADSPQEIVLVKGDDVWGDLTDKGYIPEEIVIDVVKHGFDTPAKQQNPGLKAGTKWTVSDEVQQMRADRLAGVQSSTYNPTQATAKPVVDTLKKNESVWTESIKAGVAPRDIPAVMEAVEKEKSKDLDFNNLPVGFTFTIPAHLIHSNDRHIVPLGAEPTKITIVAGSNPIKELVKAGIANPMTVIDTVLEFNGLTHNSARHIKPGTQIIVPAGIIPTPSPEKQLPPVVEKPVNKPSPELVLAPEKPTPEVAPIVPPPPAPVSIPAPEVVPAPPSPEIQAPQTINDVLIQMREKYAKGKVDTAEMVEFINKNFKHPAVNPGNGITEQNVNQLFMLPEPQTGFDFVVNPNTFEAQAITSAPMLAFAIVSQDYAHWLTENNDEFKHLQGKFRVQFGDMNDGQHKTHQFALAFDWRSIFVGQPGTLFPDGPLFMPGTPGFNQKFTEAVMLFMRDVQLHGKKLLKQFITSSTSMERHLTGRNEPGDWIAVVDGHKDHLHIKLHDEFAVEDFFSPAMPIDPNIPVTGGTTPYIDPVPITSPPTTEAPTTTTEPTTTTTEPAPEETSTTTQAPETTTTTAEVPPSTVGEFTKVGDGYWLVPANAEEIISNSNLTPAQKDFRLKIFRATVAAMNSGAPIQPSAVIAQAEIESGFGQGRGAVQGNNVFSVKESDRAYAIAHPDEFVWIQDDEKGPDGKLTHTPFKKYASLQEAFEDYARIIGNAPHYADAEKCRGDLTAYLNGLMHELRKDCSIGKRMGEDGVMSYSTTQNYVATLEKYIQRQAFDSLFVINPNQQELQATLEWAQLHGAA